VQELVVGDSSPRTVRAYYFALLTWFRVLWLLEVPWDRATELDSAAMVGWLRVAWNPQRRRRAGSTAPGAVNIKTGKPAPADAPPQHRPRDAPAHDMNGNA
jgi:hypothetical protein